MYNMTIEIGSKFEIRTISSVNGGDDKNTKTCRDGGTTKAKLRKVTGHKKIKTVTRGGGWVEIFPKKRNGTVTGGAGGTTPKRTRNATNRRPLKKSLKQTLT